MARLSKRTGILVATATMVYISGTGCRANTSPVAPKRDQCPVSSADTTSWVRTPTTLMGVSLLLPDGMEKVVRPDTTPGEFWQSGRRTVGYLVEEGPLDYPEAETIPVGERILACTTADGVGRINIFKPQMESEISLYAVWGVGARRFALHGSSREPNDVPFLLAIAKGVQMSGR